MKLIFKLLPIQFKIWLYKVLHKDIASCGEYEDTELAHVNPYEIELLKSVGGAGQVNPKTKLKGYFGGGGSTSTPSETQTTFSREAPEIEARKLALYDASAQLTQRPVNIPAFQAAAPTALEQQAYRDAAMTGTGTTATNQGIASALGAQTTAMQAPDVSGFLNPYNQFVTDEINRQAAMQRNAIGAQAVGSGAFGGGREGIQLAELQGRTQQAIGAAAQQNYGQALQAAQNQQATQVAAQQQAASQLGAFGQQQQNMQGQDIQRMLQAGQSQRAAGQQALDAARQTELARAYEPYQRLEFQKGIMTALPTAASQVTSTTAPGTNPLAQAAGTGLAAYAAFNPIAKGMSGKV